MNREAMVFGVLAFNLASGQVVPLDDSAKQAEVQLMVVDSFGRRLERPHVFVDRLDTGNTAETIPGRSQMSLKYGNYRFRLDQSGYSPTSRSVRVGSATVMLTLCVTVAPIENSMEKPLLKGRVEPFDPRLECSVVRLIPVYCADPPAETGVSSGGRFALEDVRPGKYLVVLLAPEKVCSITEHDVLMRAVQEITVPGFRRPAMN